jgi:hypothetical protein
MSITKIARILADHSITTKLVVDRIMALEEGTIKQGGVVRPHSEWIDVTGWSGMQLLGWLEYDEHDARQYMGL